MNLHEGPARAAALLAAFDLQRAACARDGGLDRAHRMAALAALDAILEKHSEDFAQAIDADFRGRARQETLLLEVFPSRSAVRHARRHLGRWMKPRRAPTGFWFKPGRSQVVPQPLGVVGIVVPWNYPLYLAMGPAVAALAAGNRVLVKMSESAPRTAELLAGVVARHLPPDVLAIVTGDAEIGKAFTALPFDHLLFTGSTPVGRDVMRAASANLTPVTLELGGKSPAIVGESADVADAADRIVFGKALNAGQTCIAPDYVLLPRAQLEPFIVAARATARRLFPTLRDNRDYTAIIDARHLERLVRWREEARTKGARIEALGDEDLDGSGKLAPTLIVGAPDDAAVMREEIFGPLLPLVPYDRLDDAIAYVNARPRPLALYVFARDAASIDRVIARTVSGGVTVNETLLHIAQEELPFGGVGPSGMGEYHGRAGFDTFSKRKAVFRPSRLSALKLLRPPYGARFERLVRLLLR